MSAAPSNPVPAVSATTSTFFTVEIRGGSPELAASASVIINLGLETAIALVRSIQGSSKGAPALVLHDGSVQA